jgi:hypothetical protein
MTRIAQSLVHALFAMNQEYFISDKYAKRLLDQFAACPRDFVARLELVLARPGGDSAELGRSTELLGELWQQVVDLTAGTYKPRFQL